MNVPQVVLDKICTVAVVPSNICFYHMYHVDSQGTVGRVNFCNPKYKYISNEQMQKLLDKLNLLAEQGEFNT